MHIWSLVRFLPFCFECHFSSKTHFAPLHFWISFNINTSTMNRHLCIISIYKNCHLKYGLQGCIKNKPDSTQGWRKVVPKLLNELAQDWKSRCYVYLFGLPIHQYLVWNLLLVLTVYFSEPKKNGESTQNCSSQSLYTKGLTEIWALMDYVQCAVKIICWLNQTKLNCMFLIIFSNYFIQQHVRCSKLCAHDRSFENLLVISRLFLFWGIHF
jgi:hypothetical protein